MGIWAASTQGEDGGRQAFRLLEHGDYHPYSVAEYSNDKTPHKQSAEQAEPHLGRFKQSASADIETKEKLPQNE